MWHQPNQVVVKNWSNTSKHFCMLSIIMYLIGVNFFFFSNLVGDLLQSSWRKLGEETAVARLRLASAIIETLFHKLLSVRWKNECTISACICLCTCVCISLCLCPYLSNSGSLGLGLNIWVCVCVLISLCLCLYACVCVSVRARG